MFSCFKYRILSCLSKLPELSSLFRSYQYFRFSEETLGIVTVKKSRHGEETTFKMTKLTDNIIPDELPEELVPPGWSVDRQAFLTY